MSLSILFVAATPVEAEPLRRITGLDESGTYVSSGGCRFELLITGIGPVATAWSMTRWLTLKPKPDLVINAGIAGSFRDEIGPGKVVIPVTDLFADAGVEGSDGFMTLYEAGIEKPDKYPFIGGRLISDNRFTDQATQILKPVNAITVNTSTGSPASKSRLNDKFNPDIETMEGAAFFYICSMERVPSLALRSISNMTGSRDKKRWDIPLAIENLTIGLRAVITKIS
jgi:futalosine hydrolase